MLLQSVPLTQSIQISTVPLTTSLQPTTSIILPQEPLQQVIAYPQQQIQVVNMQPVTYSMIQMNRQRTMPYGSRLPSETSYTGKSSNIFGFLRFRRRSFM